MFFMENPKIIGLQEGNCVNFNIRNAIVTHAEALLLHAEGLLLQLEAKPLPNPPLKGRDFIPILIHPPSL